MKVALRSLSKVFGSEIDLFICSSSFEERCLSVPKSLDPTKVKRVLVCENQDYESFISQNTEILLKYFGRRAKKVLLRTDNPVFVADNLQEALHSSLHSRVHSCVVDITTFTHEGLLILIRILNESGFSGSLRFIYAGAEDYAINAQDSQKWLSKGVDSVRSVLGYPGAMMPSRLLHLVVLVGFESERAEKLIEAYEPATISLGLGAQGQSVSPKHYLTNEEFHRKVLDFAQNLATQNTASNQFSFSCVDPFETKNSLMEQIALHPDHNTVIAPMNTKVSTLGAALVALENEHIQISYAHAVQYNTDGYSSPSHSSRVFDGKDFLRQTKS
jgi:hypothetical protein